MFDWIIRGAAIVDGDGGPRFRGDVAIEGDRIAAVGAMGPAEARQVVDGEGLVLTPGFIDVHSHSDHALLVEPGAEGKITQGVTTEIIGNCGYSAAPLSSCNRSNRADGLRAFRLDPVWSSFDEYLGRLEAARPALNVATLAGHGNLRSAVLGYENRQPDARDQAAMEALLDEALDAGAYGWSTGLAYAPGMFAGEAELAGLTRRVARRDGLAASHLRSESDRLLEALDEFLRVGADSGCRLQVSHLKASGRPNWGKTGDAIRRVEAYEDAHASIAFDRYPYTASSTSLDTFLPDDAHAGGSAALVERLKSRSDGPRLREAFREAVETCCGWDGVQITSMELGEPHAAEGLTLAACAARDGADPAELGLALIIESGGRVGMVCFSMCEPDVEDVLAHRLCMVGSDASVRSRRGILHQGCPHPRAYGTFPRYLSEYVLKRRLLTLEEAVRRMTALAADHFRLRGRGRVRAGDYADLVLFDPVRFRDTATYAQPHAVAEGLIGLWVNGRRIIEPGREPEGGCGRVLRMGRD